MSVDWASLLNTALTAVMVLGQMKLAKVHPLAPWQAIGSSAYITVVNPSRNPLSVSVSAKEVDDATRSLGIVAPCDRRTFRLPYADTDVRVHFADNTAVIGIYRPDTMLITAPVEQQETTNEEGLCESSGFSRWCC